MSEISFINANEFIETLKLQGLVIVSVKDLEFSKEMKIKRLMRRNSLSLQEIAENNLLPLKDKKSVNDWILRGKIKPTETYREAGGKRRVMVLTSAIRRLGYED
jgi:dephospho-CoA kinase